jgi:hypothetical protein
MPTEPEVTMSKIVLDAELRAKLNGGGEPLEFTDEAGNVVGRYVPGDSLARLADVLFPPLTPDEIAEARKEMLERGGVSTDDMLTVIRNAKRARESAK